MSVASDAVWIVEELLDEILGRIKFRDMEKKFNERMTHEASEVKKEHDWAKTDRRGVEGVDRQMFLRGGRRQRGNHRQREDRRGDEGDDRQRGER